MIFLIFVGLFYYATNMRFIAILLSSSLSLVRSSASPPKHFRLIMVPSSSTGPLLTSSQATTSACASPAPTPPNKMAKPNAYFALSTTPSALCCSTPPCHHHTRLKPWPLPHICSTGVHLLLYSMPSLPIPSSAALGLLLPSCVWLSLLPKSQCHDIP